MNDTPNALSPLGGHHFIRANARRSIPLADKSVHCVVTSPPYFGLRDYGTDGQLGLERTPEEYVANQVAVFREVRRVLRDDGTLWLNIGSSFASKKIESDQYILRDDVTENEYKQAIKSVTQTLSQLWFANESAKSSMPFLLEKTEEPTRKLPESNLSSLPEGISHSSISCDDQRREILFPVLREVGISNSKENISDRLLSDMRGSIQQVSVADCQNTGESSFLFPRMLVQFQSERQSLSMGGRAIGQNVISGQEMAKINSAEGPEYLSDLSRHGSIGISSHSSVQHASFVEMGNQQRIDVMQKVSCEISEPRDGIRRNFDCYRRSTDHRVELIFRKRDISNDVIHLFKPCYIIKPKDDIGIPWMLVNALRSDGWYLRSEIIWNKPNAMPESVRDRPSKSHEQVFMMTKSKNYYYDTEAVKDPVAKSTLKDKRIGVEKTRDFEKASNRFGQGTSASRRQATNAVGSKDGRNSRSVWNIPVGGFKGAHFATMPIRLAKQCILASSSSKGCCPACHTPWRQIIERTRVATRPGLNTKTTDESGQLAHEVIGNRDPERHVTEVKVLGWESGCTCREPNPIPCVVFDPFGGAGTTARAAQILGRHSISTELSAEYIGIAVDRLREPLPVEGAKGVNRKASKARQLQEASSVGGQYDRADGFLF